MPPQPLTPNWTVFDHQISEDLRIPFVKRGGDSSGANAQAETTSSSIPTIGGSSAGFIGLIVGLSVLFLICAIVVFILLRNHKPDAYERHARRVLAGKRESSIYEVPLGPPAMRSKFRNLFHFGRKHEGWVRANSGDADEWDASEEFRPGHGQARELTDRDVEDLRQESKDEPFTPPAITKEQMERNDTSESIELSVPDVSHTGLHIETAPHVTAMHAEYSDPFNTSPTSMYPRDPEEETIQMQSSSPRPERFSVQSGENPGSVRSMLKFQSGTKFKESF
ncbi:hypothetical protein ABKN59_009325 [Abortiporus biennis]